MSRVLILDGLAHRYGCLPSEILTRADTLDMLILDCYRSWEQYQRDKMEAEQNGTPKPANLPINKLQEMMDRVKRK